MGIFSFLKRVFRAFSGDKIGQHSAAFAYVALFSLGPLLLVVISIVGFVFGEEAASGALFGRLSDTIGADTARVVQDAVAHTYQARQNGWALAIGIGGVLLAAAGITNQLQNTFDAIYGVVPDPKAGVKRTIYVKIKNSLLVIAGGILVAVSVGASAIVVGLGKRADDAIDIPAPLLEGINTLASLMLFILVLALVYQAVPNVRIPARIILSASAVVALLFVLGKVVLGFIIGRNGTAGAYGAAAALITLLLWVYYSAQILFLGAEGMKVYGREHTAPYAPKRFNRKRQTVNIDSGSYLGRLLESAATGYRKGTRRHRQ